MDIYLQSIDEQLSGKMSKEGQILFEKQLRENKDLRQIYESCLEVIEPQIDIDNIDCPEFLKKIQSKMMDEGQYITDVDKEKYIYGNLESEKKNILERRMKNDIEFANEIKTFRVFEEALYKISQPDLSSKPKRIFFKRWLTIAAILSGVLVACLFVFSPSSPTHHFADLQYSFSNTKLAEEVKNVPNLISLGREEREKENEAFQIIEQLNKAIQEKGNEEIGPSEVLNSFDQFVQKNDDLLKHKFYYANLLSHSNDSDNIKKSISLLENLNQIFNDINLEKEEKYSRYDFYPFEDFDVKWSLAVAYNLGGKNEKESKTLKEILNINCAEYGGSIIDGCLDIQVKAKKQLLLLE